MRIRAILMVLAWLIVSVGVSAQELPDNTAPLRTVTHDGVERRYLMYVPESYTGDEPLPAVFVLHGRGGDGAAMALLTEMNQFAEEYGFIAVYPDGQKIEREEGTDRLWGFTRGIEVYVQPEHDDVDFLKTVVDHVADEVNLDRSRVYVTGFSNGGYMVHRLACEANDTFAAFATVGASGFAALDRICDGTEPVPLLIMHGTDDSEVLWDGIVQTFDVATGGTQDVYTSLPIIALVDYWVRHNVCLREPDYTEIPKADEDATTSVVAFEFLCKDDATIAFYTIIRGGHNWPGVIDVLPEAISGAVNTDIHASEVIWQFFADKTLPDDRDDQ